MLITCISASNTKDMGKNSASTKVCELIKQIIRKDYCEDIEINVIPLMDYEMIPCYLCGKCSEDMRCKYDEAFNRLLSQLSKSDTILYVIPHYSPIPSKLMIMFEKINEIVYVCYLKNKEFLIPIKGKKVGIIGHGGMVENKEVLNYYYDNLVTPVASTLKQLTFEVIGIDKKPNGVVFGLKNEECFKKVESNIFPEIVHDWGVIETRIRPLIKKIILTTTVTEDY